MDTDLIQSLLILNNVTTTLLEASQSSRPVHQYTEMC